MLRIRTRDLPSMSPPWNTASRFTGAGTSVHLRATLAGQQENCWDLLWWGAGLDYDFICSTRGQECGQADWRKRLIPGQK
jgi:hypothetical protein